MSDVIEKIFSDAKKDYQQSKREIDEMLKALNKKNEELDKKSMDNFSAWRDYLHKYYVVILAFIGGSGILNSANNLQNPFIQAGIYLALEGIITGFITINLYFYFERKWFQITSYIQQTNPYNLYEHPDVKNDIIKSMKLNIKKIIKENKQIIKDSNKKNDNREIIFLKKQIRADKIFLRLLNYFGQQFGWIETIWLTGVISSLILTIVGVIVIFKQIT